MLKNDVFEIEKHISNINQYVQFAEKFFLNQSFQDADFFNRKAILEMNLLLDANLYPDRDQHKRMTDLGKRIKELKDKLSEVDVSKVIKIRTALPPINHTPTQPNKVKNDTNYDTQLDEMIKPIDHTGVSFEDVVGCDEIKDFINQEWILRFNPDYQKVFIDNQPYTLFEPHTLERGILFYGMPGTGKTFVAKAIATKVNAKFFSISASDILSKYKGDTVAKIKAVFERAAKENRAIIFIDEIDSILMKQSESSDQHNLQDLNEFLSEMDGINFNYQNLLYIGTTNNPNFIAPAALRNGRFGKLIRIDIPDLNTRLILIQKLLDKNKFSKSIVEKAISPNEVAIRTPGFSQADIQALINRIISTLNSKVLNNMTKKIENNDKNPNYFKGNEFFITYQEILSLIKTANKSDSKLVLDNLAKFEEERNLRPRAGGVKEHHQSVMEEAIKAAKELKLDLSA